MPVYLMFGLTFSSEYSLQIYNENLNAEGVLTARRPSLETVFCWQNYGSIIQSGQNEEEELKFCSQSTEII